MEELYHLSTLSTIQNQYLHNNELNDPNIDYYKYLASSFIQEHQDEDVACEDDEQFDDLAEDCEELAESFYNTSFYDSALQNDYNTINTRSFYQNDSSADSMSHSLHRTDLSLHIKSPYMYSQNSDGNESTDIYSILYVSEYEPTDILESINRRYLRSAFNTWTCRWRSKLIEMKPVDHFLSREYYRSKAEYQLQQKICIASVHFKISILSDCFHKWRMYSIGKHVKRRMGDVASIHYADKITNHCYKLWMDAAKEQRMLQRKADIHIMEKHFKVWRNWTLLSKEYSLQTYRHFIIKNAYSMWKKHLLLKKAATWNHVHIKRHVFTLWSLQLLKRKLQRRLSRSHRIKLCQQSFFTKWKSKLEERCERRKLFLCKLDVIMMRCYWDRWKKLVEREALIRSNAISVGNICRQNTLHHFFSVWQHQYSIECFKTQHYKQNSEFMLRSYFHKWKRKRQSIILGRKMEIWHTIQSTHTLHEFFKRWQQKKIIRDQRNQRFMEALGVVNQNYMGIYFRIWKQKFQHEIVIKKSIVSRQKTTLARYFKLWIFFIMQAKLKKTKQLNIQSKIFSYWRECVKEKAAERQNKVDKDNHILQKSVSHWKDYASISKQRRETNIVCFARHWLDVTQQKVLARKILETQKVSSEIIRKVHFAKWKHRFDTAKRKRIKMEEDADQFFHQHVYNNVFSRWIRHYSTTCILRDYQQEKDLLLLSTTFKHWLLVSQQNMQLLVYAFIQKLTSKSNTPQNTPTTVMAIQQCHSPTIHNKHTKYNDSLASFYKESIDDTLQLNDKSDNNYFASNPSLPLSASYDISSIDYNNELVDYNTDNDVDQEQIWDEATSRSELQLLFSSMNTTITEDNFMLQQKECNWTSPKWIYLWKKRYIYSKILAQQKRFMHDSIIERNSISLMSLSGTPRNQRIVQLSLSFEEQVHSSGGNMDNSKVSRLVASLNYWKHLDLSTVFYAWWKYTEKKKNHRLLQDNLLAKKCLYKIHVVFLHWNRALYGIRASLYLRRKTLMVRYFYQFMQYHSSQQIKLARKHHADEWHSKFMLKSYFRDWKKKRQLEQLLCGVNKSALYEDHETRHNEYTAVRNKRILTSLFHVWKIYTSKMKLAEAHHEKMLQTKYLNTWWQCNLIKGHKKMKFQKFQREHQLKKSFLLWKRKMHCQIQVHQAETTKEGEIKALIFSEWKKWTKLKLKARLKGNVFTYKSHYQLLHDAFKEWKLYHKQIISAVQHHNYLLKQKIFSSWHSITTQLIDEKTKVTTCRDKSLQFLVSRSFTQWKEAHQSRLKLKDSEESILLISFRVWKKTTLYNIANKQYSKSKYNEVFQLWKEKFVSRKKTRLLTKRSNRKWKQLVEESRIKEENLKVYLNDHDEKITKQYFFKWKQKLQVMTISKTHSKGKLLTIAFSRWKNYTNNRHFICQCTDSIQKIHKHNLVLSSFQVWCQSFARMKMLANIKQRLTMIMVREKAVQWRLITMEHILSSKNDKKLLKNYFSKWLRNLELTKKAIQYNKHSKKKKCLHVWIRFTRNHKKYKEMDSKLKSSIKMKGNRMMKLVFQKWFEYKVRSIEMRKVYQDRCAIASNHYNQNLVKRLFRHWRMFTNCEIMMKKRHKRITQHYFGKWKSKIAVGNVVITMFKQKRYEKYWKKWRKACIQHQTLKDMKKRDERKVITVVFSSWKRSTKLRRTLPKQLKTAQTAIWFYKWRNRCNISSSAQCIPTTIIEE